MRPVTTIVAATFALTLLACSVRAEVTSDHVRSSVEKGIAALRASSRPDGSWPDHGGHKGGVTALSVLAMLNAGVPVEDPIVQAGLAALGKVPDEATYVVSLKCQAYAAAGAKNDPHLKARLEHAAGFLIQTQLDNGMWGYSRQKGRGDNSNTQFALLGLHEAANAGVKIPQQVWDLSARHFMNTQYDDGSWEYQSRRKGYGSMTAAGVASLYICGQRLNVGGKKEFINGVYPNCGRYKQNEALAAGLNWMAKHFSVTSNPGKGGQWLHYYLYGMERVGMISGRRNFGANDWYRAGAEHLVETQSPSGVWGRGLYDAAFAVLFLAKGNRPVLIQKLQWSGTKPNAGPQETWNRNIHDVENFIAFVGDKLGKTPTWQTASLDLSLEDLRQSPILFITGHEFPAFTEADKKKLRQFTETGGTLLLDACCGSKAFAEGFADFAREVFPEYLLAGSVQRLEPTHPVFRSYYKIDDLYDLHGIDVGCRTAVFFAPRAISPLWEMQDFADGTKNWSEDAFKLGLNIAAYATGKELLRDKLDMIELPASTRRDDKNRPDVPRGAVRVARLVHNGHYDADPHAMVNLAEMLRDKAKVDVVAMEKAILPNDETIYDYPVVFMTGHNSFELSADEIAALRQYLKRGGTLVADACCGRGAFDNSFRAMIGQVFPDIPMTPLPADNPIYTGQAGAPLGELQYRKILCDELGGQRGTTQPPLEAVVIDGRSAVIYSKYDFSCGLENDNPFSCRGYVEADARKLALNIFLYAISY